MKTDYKDFKKNRCWLNEKSLQECYGIYFSPDGSGNPFFLYLTGFENLSSKEKKIVANSRNKDGMRAEDSLQIILF
jgi:hypothetical protein